MKKSLFIILSSLSLIFTLFISPPNTHASGNGKIKENKKEVIVKKEDAFYDSSIGKYITAYKIVDGELVAIDEGEYKSLEQGTEEVLPQTFSAALFGDTFNYVAASSSTLSAPTEKASATLVCNATSCRVDKTINSTYTNSFTVGLTSPEIAAIKANAGFTWSVSATNSSTYSFTISKGQAGYIGFSPYYRKTTGTLYAYYEGLPSGSKTVEGRAPKKLSNGELDGIYKFIFQ